MPTVVELRGELKARGLHTSGLKAQLERRLADDDTRRAAEVERNSNPDDACAGGDVIGASEGAAEGQFDGAALGEKDGFSVGCKLGVKDGDNDGEKDGAKDGDTDGESLGACDGDSVGAMLGAGLLSGAYYAE